MLSDEKILTLVWPKFVIFVLKKISHSNSNSSLFIKESLKPVIDSHEKYLKNENVKWQENYLLIKKLYEEVCKHRRLHVCQDDFLLNINVLSLARVSFCIHDYNIPIKEFIEQALTALTIYGSGWPYTNGYWYEKYKYDLEQKLTELINEVL